MAAKSKTLPPELIAARPHLAGNLDERHPSMGLPPGKPPAKYTIALHEKICEHVRNGNRPVVAASLAGLSAATFYNWMQRGREGDPHLCQFAEDVEQAFNQAEARALAVVTESFTSEDPDKRDPENSKWFLERARSAGYSKQVKTVVESQIADFIQKLESELEPALFHKVLAIYLGFSNGEHVPRKELTSGSDEAETE